MSNLQLKDISWGKTDAKNEFLDDSDENRATFKKENNSSHKSMVCINIFTS